MNTFIKYWNEEDLRQFLKLRCADGLRSFCRQHNLDAGNVSNIIAGKKRMMASVVTALGYEAETCYRRIT